MVTLDKENCIILTLMQEDCRMSLTDIAKKVGLSIDAVKKRLNRMMQEGIFYPKIQLRPRHFGFSTIVEVRIELHNCSKKDLDGFISYVTDNPAVVEVFSFSGSWDIGLVLLARDAQDLGRITADIRGRFRKIIRRWIESLTTGVYKFERYDILALMGYKKPGEGKSG